MRALARWLIFLGLGPLWIVLTVTLVLMLHLAFGLALGTGSVEDTDQESLSLFHGVMMLLIVVQGSVSLVPLAYLGGAPICGAACFLIKRLQGRGVAYEPAWILALGVILGALFLVLVLAAEMQERLPDLLLTSSFGYFALVAGVAASVMICWLLTDDLREPAEKPAE